METETVVLIAAAVAAAIMLILILMLVMRSRRKGGEKQTKRLREGFGPEYAKAVGDQGRSKAEADLVKREQSANLFPVRVLSPAEVTRYTENWTATQAQFVEDPGAALTSADHLVAEVIAARGYPATEFEQGASSLSVDHPRAVQEYRTAHDVAMRNQRNAVPTDELRTAMVQYHTVFTELMAN